jgi:hypothetical protein
MTRPRQVLVPAFNFVLIFVLGISLTGRASSAQEQAKAAGTRITAAANVTLRGLPASTSPVVAQLPLGTEVTDAGPAGLDKTWVRVRLANSREGWLLASLTKPLDQTWRWPTFDRIIAERLGRKGDGFSALAELVAFIERVAPEYTDPDGRARIDLDRLRAMSAALAAIPSNGLKRDPYASWLKAHEASKNCDLMIVAGSSLEVLPVAGLPMRALENGAHLILINHSSTYLDVRADVVFHEDIVDIFPSIVKEVLGE